MISTSSTPAALLATQLHILSSALPSVRDGDPNGIHDARIATRRIRELLRLADHKAADDLRERFKLMGRALGRVRDADVKLALLGTLETRLPHVAPALVPLRYEEGRSRASLVRDLIKRLERLHVERLVDALAGRKRRSPGLLQSSGRGPWRHALRSTIAARGQLTEEAIEHATGVYFPKRMHAARIALKKLRYAMEVANRTHAADLKAPLRDLKKGQEVLGELHDRQALLDGLPQDGLAEADKMLEVVRQAANAEIESLHQRYLSRRGRLREIAHSARTLRFGHPWRLRSLALAGVLAVSSGAYLVQQRLPEPGQ